MTDRITVIAHLGALVADAAQRGDDRAADTLRDAIGLLVEDATAAKTLSSRRVHDAERQRRKREKSQDVTVHHVTKRDGPKVSPDPFLTPEDNDTKTPGARDFYAESVENLQGILHSRIGDDLWTDVDGFIGRREYATWKAWIKEMLTILTGSKALPTDLAQVCRDDAALARPIGSPKGLRTFVASAVAERTNPVPQHGSNGARRGGVAQRTFDNGRKALDDLP